MYATYLRLDITVYDGWRAVVRAAEKKLTPRARRDRRIAKRVIASIARCSRIIRKHSASSELGVSDADHFPSSTEARHGRAFRIYGAHHAPLHDRNHLPASGLPPAHL
jgi:hypothetical protein